MNVNVFTVVQACYFALNNFDAYPEILRSTTAKLCGEENVFGSFIKFLAFSNAQLPNYIIINVLI